MMKIAFLTEMGFTGSIAADHPNMRTEFAWMHALQADHIPIRRFDQVRGYDRVMIIFPKGQITLSADGSYIPGQTNPISSLLTAPIVSTLKQHNTRVYYVQEGPSWWFNDYALADQINFYNMLADCDGIFAHNQADVSYYRGLFPNKQVEVISTLLVEHLIQHIEPNPQPQVIIGGNMARWYGGFESLIVAREFGLSISVQTSHASKPGEDLLVHCLPRLCWFDWMSQLSTFKYAVHLMPIVAAGTFALNCAYFGIPCIGNRLVDTQRLCFPQTSVDVYDVECAQQLAQQLSSDSDLYQQVSQQAKDNYNRYFSKQQFLDKMHTHLA